MRAPSPRERNALRHALLKEIDAVDDPVQALRVHRALARAAVAVLPHFDVAPELGNAPVHVVVWPQSLEVSVFVTNAMGEPVRVNVGYAREHPAQAARATNPA